MKATEIRNVFCIGGGTIGASWAVCFATNRRSITLYDISDAALEAAQKMEG